MQRMSEDLEPISFGQELLCGMAGCDAPTTTGLLERDEHRAGLWRLLPGCPRCLSRLSGLRAGGQMRLRECDEANGAKSHRSARARRH